VLTDIDLGVIILLFMVFTAIVIVANAIISKAMMDIMEQVLKSHMQTFRASLSRTISRAGGASEDDGIMGFVKDIATRVVVNHPKVQEAIGGALEQPVEAEA